MDQSTQQEMEAADDECCRICLTVKNDLNSDSDRHLNSSKFLQGIFLNFTGIDVLKTENISSWICDDCEDKLMDFHRFGQQCCESNKILLEKAEIDISLKEDPEPACTLLERLERIEPKEVPEVIPESENLLLEERKLNNVENKVPNVAGSQIPVNSGITSKLEIVYSEPSFPGFEKLYECPYCLKTYQKDRHSSFMNHLKIHQPKEKGESPENECNVCFKVLKNVNSVAAHRVLSHIKYFCEGCDKPFRANEVPKHSKCQLLKNAPNLKKATVVPKNEAPLSCRACLTTSGDHFVDIFHSTFQNAFQCCTGIDVKSTPGITTSVCDVCEAKLMDFYNFQKKCWESDLVLRKKFKK